MDKHLNQSKLMDEHSSESKEPVKDGVATDEVAMSATDTNSVKVGSAKDKKKGRKKGVKKGKCAVCRRKLKPLVFIVETCRCGTTVHIEGHRRRRCMEEHEAICVITNQERFETDRQQELKRAAAAHERAWRVGMG